MHHASRSVVKSPWRQRHLLPFTEMINVPSITVVGFIRAVEMRWHMEIRGHANQELDTVIHGMLMQYRPHGGILAHLRYHSLPFHVGLIYGDRLRLGTGVAGRSPFGAGPDGSSLWVLQSVRGNSCETARTSKVPHRGKHQPNQSRFIHRFLHNNLPVHCAVASIARRKASVHKRFCSRGLAFGTVLRVDGVL